MRQVALRSRDLAEFAAALNHLTRNRNGEVTLTDGAAATTVVDPTVTPDSVLSFDPLTANAAAEKAAGTMYVTAVDRLRGSFIITHANNAQTDRTFRWLAAGD